MRYSIAFAALLVLVGCSEPDANKERKDGYSQKPGTAADSLLQEVMDAHDVTMAKMGKLDAARKKLQHLADSLTALGNKRTQAAMARSLDSQLKSAGEKMEDWMTNFNVDSAQADFARRVQYLKEQKEKVNAVKTEVLSSLSRVDSVLKK